MYSWNITKISQNSYFKKNKQKLNLIGRQIFLFTHWNVSLHFESTHEHNLQLIWAKKLWNYVCFDYSSFPHRYPRPSTFLKMCLSQVSFSPGFERDLGKNMWYCKKHHSKLNKNGQLTISVRRQGTTGKQERGVCPIFQGQMCGYRGYCYLSVEARNVNCHRKFPKY